MLVTPQHDKNVPMSDLSATPKLDALFSTRRWVMSIWLGSSWLILFANGALNWPNLSAIERVALTLCTVFMAIGVLLGRSYVALWGFPASRFVILLAVVTAPATTHPWIGLSEATIQLTISIVLLVNKRIGMIVPFLGAIAYFAMTRPHPSVVITSSQVLTDGWVATVAVLASGLGSWWAWNRLREQANVADAQFVSIRVRTEEALSTQERSQIWRKAAVLVHESVLNSLRYVMRADDVDRDGLRLQLAKALPPRPSKERELSLSWVLSSVDEDVIATGISMPAQTPDVMLSSEAAHALRAALIEAARNAINHGRATRVLISTEVVEEHLCVEIRDNGVGIAPTALPGMGFRQVLGLDLAAVHATVTRESSPGDTRIAITIPLDPAEAHILRAAPTGWFNQARFLLTVPLAAIVTVGLAYLAMLTGVSVLFGLLALVSALISLAYSWWHVLPMHRMTSWLALVFILLSAIVPWLILVSPLRGAMAVLIGSAINVAGFATVIIAAWSRAVIGTVGLTVWGLGTLLVTAAITPSERTILIVSLTSALIVLPIVLIVAYTGSRRYQLALESLNRAQQRAIIERARAQAGVALDAHLSSAIENALSLLTEIADGRELDAGTRHELSLIHI